MITGAKLIARERNRQVTKEKFTSAHDDEHELGEMTQAAIIYATAEVRQMKMENLDDPFWAEDWPWENGDFKPSPDAIRNLTKAGALIAAEIDRLLRKQKAAIATKPPSV